MPIPDGTWCHISRDFIVDLLWSNGYIAIVTVTLAMTRFAPGSADYDYDDDDDRRRVS